MENNGAMEKALPVLGIDIGGTKIAGGICAQGKLLHKKNIQTPHAGSKEEILHTILSFIQSFSEYQFSAIGIGIPGLVDAENGIVFNLANIPAFQEVHLKEFLEERLDMPVHINNDANCFALGEYHNGLKAKHKNMVGITLGTGVGTGIIANGQLYSGTYCGAGEWGGASYLDKTFEFYCSGKFFHSHMGLSTKRCYQLAKSNDAKAMETFNLFGGHLGAMIKQLMFVLAPEAIVLGGSISNALPLFAEPLMREINTFPYPAIRSNLKIFPSNLEGAAILGAGSLALQKNPTAFGEPI
jgi:glucokinase